MKYADQQPGLLRLNQDWRFYEGALNKMPEDRHGAVRGLFGKANIDWGPIAPDLDEADWERVDLPHDANVRLDFTEKDEVGNFHGGKKRGPVWYRKHFLLTEADHDRQLLLEFEGMSRNAEIYVNGIFLYENRSGYHPFTIDITDVATFPDDQGREALTGGLQPGENVIAVAIDPTDGEGWWYEGVGIYRSVWLIRKNTLHIAEDGVFVKPGPQWTEVSVEVENTGYEPRSGELRVYLVDADLQEITGSERRVTVGGNGVETIRVSLDPGPVEVWSPEHPVLYRCICELHSEAGVADYRKVYYGYRTIRFEADTGFYLNDVPMKLRGFCIHQDHTGIGVAVPYAIKEYRLQLLKQIGANAIRTAHHTDPEIQEIADRIGLMVMEESRSLRASEETFAHARSMARKARNHPSVILYSLFNEEPLQGTETGARMARRLREVIRREDDTRPFTAAMNAGFLNKEGAAQWLDVIGINYNTVEYDKAHALWPDKPIIGSETVSAFMIRGEYETDEAQHLIADVDASSAPWGNTTRDGWKQVAERPFIGGTFVWTGLDYRGEPTPFRWPTIASLFGVLDSCGFKKGAGWLYQAFWTDKPMVHALPDLDQPIDPGTSVTFQVYTNCEEAELFLNGTSLGRKPVDPYAMASWETAYTMGTLRAVGYRDGQPVCDEIQRTPGAVAGLRMRLSKEYMTADGEDAIAVNVEAVDALGNFVPSADTLVFFETEGGAKVIGTGNGDPNSHEPDGMHYRRLFHGRCQAIIRTTDGSDVTVRVYAEGLQGDEEFIIQSEPTSYLQ